MLHSRTSHFPAWPTGRFAGQPAKGLRLATAMLSAYLIDRHQPTRGDARGFQQKAERSGVADRR